MNSTRHAALRRIFLPDASVNLMVALDSEKLRHLRKVLRMEWDEALLVTDGRGHLFEGRLEKVGEKGGVRIGTCLREEPEPLPLELVICLPKNATMDWIVEKAAECGVTAITPVVSSRSVVKPSRGDLEKYVYRWQAIIDGAVEQSERLWRPGIAAPILWGDWLMLLDKINDRTTPAVAGCRSIGDDRTTPAVAGCRSIAFVSELRAVNSEAEALLECWQELCSIRRSAVRVFIGPEGGVSDQERTDIGRLGFKELSLGSTVLRVETAVVSALTLLRVSRLVSVT